MRELQDLRHRLIVLAIWAADVVIDIQVLLMASSDDGAESSPMRYVV